MPKKNEPLVVKNSKALKKTQSAVYNVKNFFFEPDESAIAPRTGDVRAIIIMVILPAYPQNAVPMNPPSRKTSVTRFLKNIGNNAVTINTVKLVFAKSYRYHANFSFLSVGIDVTVSFPSIIKTSAYE